MNGRVKFFLIIAVMTVAILALLMAIAAMLLERGEADARPRKAKVSAEKAVDEALFVAKIKKSDATVIKKKLVGDDKKSSYQIEFYTNDGKEVVNYEYSVDAETGKVLGDRKMVRNTVNVTKKKNSGASEENTSEQGSAKNYIGVERAKMRVLDNAGFTEDEIELISVMLKNRDQKSYYDVEFESEDIFYDFEIDAISGKILRRQVEYPDDMDA